MLKALSDDQLLDWLRDESPCGDLTSSSLGFRQQLGLLTMAAHQPMAVCGVEEVQRLFELCGASAQVHVPSGSHVLAGAELISAQGPVESLMVARQVAQSVLAAASGIASETARIVTELRAAGHQLPLAGTVEAWLGPRALAVKATTCGGGVMHRLGLSDAVLLDAAHRVFVDVSVDDAVGRLKKTQPHKKIMVLVTSLQDALAFAEAGADILQLDGFAPDAVRQTRLTLHNSRLHPMLAVSGNVTAANAVALADAGADVLVSSALYRAAPREVEVRMSRAVEQRWSV